MALVHADQRYAVGSDFAGDRKKGTVAAEYNHQIALLAEHFFGGHRAVLKVFGAHYAIGHAVGIDIDVEFLFQQKFD